MAVTSGSVKLLLFGAQFHWTAPGIEHGDDYPVVSVKDDDLSFGSTGED